MHRGKVRQVAHHDLCAELPKRLGALVLTPNQGAHLVPLCEQEFGEVAADAAHSAGCSGHEDRVVVFMFRRHVADLGLGAPPHQLSRKLLRILDRLGCFSFRSALASIWRMRSRVTENCWPTSSSVWSLFIPMPKRMRRMRSSRAVNDAGTRGAVSRRFD